MCRVRKRESLLILVMPFSWLIKRALNSILSNYVLSLTCVAEIPLSYYLSPS